MRKTAFALLAASALMTFVGAGCMGAQKTQVETGVQVGAPEAKMDLDAEIDAIFKSGDEEQQEDAKVEGEADAVTEDKAELNAYGEGTYEIK